MKRSRILISCNSAALVLAEQLKYALEKGPCEAVLWSEEDSKTLSLMTMPFLEEAAGQYDFIVILLTEHDIMEYESAHMREVNETRAFRAGLFFATVGRERCFVAHSDSKHELPSWLTVIAPIPFQQPPDLRDEGACNNAITPVAQHIAAHIESRGPSLYHVNVPTLSQEALWQRERPRSQGGDLRGGDVVVVDTQPTPDEELALQVRSNIDSGIRYMYFLHFCPDSIDKVFQSLQVLVAPNSGGTPDFNERIRAITSQKESILVYLRRVCRERSLRIAFFPEPPQFIFRVHNASNTELAAVYLRYKDTYFIPWVTGTVAEALWRSLPSYLDDDAEAERLIIPLKHLSVDEKVFHRSVDRSLAVYFPGIENAVKQIVTGVT